MTPLSPSFEMIQAVLDQAGKGRISFQPETIAELEEFNLAEVAELTSCHVNSAHSREIKGYIAEGWILLKLQTELTFNGHAVMAYFYKKRKPEPV